METRNSNDHYFKSVVFEQFGKMSSFKSVVFELFGKISSYLRPCSIPPRQILCTSKRENEKLFLSCIVETSREAGEKETRKPEEKSRKPPQTLQETTKQIKSTKTVVTNCAEEEKNKTHFRSCLSRISSNTSSACRFSLSNLTRIST